MPTIASAVTEQYDRLWDMMRATISRFSPDEWRAGERPNLVPARWAYHAIDGMDFYARPAIEGFRRRLGPDWEGPADKLPGQEQVIEYLDDVAARLRAWLAETPDADLLSAANAFPWTGATVLDKLLYALRHTTYHLGEMGMCLRRNGADETEWR